MEEVTSDDLVIPEKKYEYLDHTADVQLHAWGSTLKEAFEQCGMSMYGYMTDLERVEITEIHNLEAEGHDMESLLFHFLDELLFLFSADPFIIGKKITITEFDAENFKIKMRVAGETFDIKKHSQESEVKAITYSAMQIYAEPERDVKEVFVIVDI